MALMVLAVAVDLHIPQSRSLKEKRASLRPIIDGARHRFDVSVAETDHQDTWQRSEIGFAVVSGDAALAERVMDDVMRFVWSFPDVTVLDEQRRWMEMD